MSERIDHINGADGAIANRLDPSSPFYAPQSPGGVSLCHGCHALGECRFGIHSEVLGDDGTIVSEVVCPPEEEGGPQVAHGGWTAGVMDELVGHALLVRDELAVTGTLTVKFVKPVPVEWDLIGRSWIVERDGRKVSVRATLELAESKAIVAEADAIMIKRPANHFDAHYEWLKSLPSNS